MVQSMNQAVPPVLHIYRSSHYEFLHSSTRTPNHPTYHICDMSLRQIVYIDLVADMVVLDSLYPLLDGNSESSRKLGIRVHANVEIPDRPADLPEGYNMMPLFYFQYSFKLNDLNALRTFEYLDAIALVHPDVSEAFTKQELAQLQPHLLNNPNFRCEIMSRMANDIRIHLEEQDIRTEFPSWKFPHVIQDGWSFVLRTGPNA
ncbi:hypothetical protein BDZ45DRAFT_755313 [Acephala macrosclerotiorum]|nr:hypothetical protein BDZ45DRAFT_755313 [Acephala macrosclerotiorum]